MPGLDGWGMLAPFLSARTQEAVRPFTPWAPFVLILLLFSSRRSSQPLWDASFWLLETAGGDVRVGLLGSVLFTFWR